VAKAPNAPGAAATALEPGHLSGTVIKLAWPVVIQQLGLTLAQLVDTFLVGHLGAPALAAVGLATTLYWFPMAGVFAVGIGATAVVARKVGAGRPDEASRSVQQALRLALIWGIGASVLFAGLASLLMQAMGAAPDVVGLGAQYIRASVIGLTFAGLLQAGTACLVGAGDTRTPMLVMLLVNATNAVLAYLLINGVGPFPFLGVQGSGLGFAIANIAGGLVVLVLLARGFGGLRWRPWRSLAWDGQEASRILQVGLPSGVEQIQFQFAFSIYTRIISGLGKIGRAHV
jgi:putative MATE family efflux protein